MKHLILSLIGIAVVGAAFVGTVSAAIPAPQENQPIEIFVPDNGSIVPGQTLKLSMSQLNKYPGDPYNVQCTIEDDNPGSLDPDIVFLSTEGMDGNYNIVITVNNLPSRTPNYPLTEQDNPYLATGVVSQGQGNEEYLTFQNLNNTNTVTVKDCTAVPSL